MQDLFGFIIYPMELGLIALAIGVSSAGIGIILFTILVRLVLSPLQIVQLRNAKAMQRLQPLIAELRQKHGKDKQVLSQKTMELYREHNVNPAMGCLPTLLQFPILIGLFYALLHLGNTIPTVYPHACSGFTTHNPAQWLHDCYAVKNAPGTTSHVYSLFHAHFLWLRNGLGQPDPVFILPILAGVTQWVQSRMMLTKSTDPQQQMMNSLMNFMPLMIVFFATRYASGLSLYWVTSTLIGIAIQYRITGWGLLPDTLAKLASYARPATPAKTSARAPSRAAKQTRGTVKNAPAIARTVPGDGSGAAADDAKTASAPPVPLNGGEATQVGNDATPNGKDGPDETAPAKTAVVRSRRKANRARGGKGGRRG